MLKSNFIVALRNFLSNKVFSFIHILGLSIGISASLLIYQIVRYESTFDKFEKDAARIYRVVMDMNFDGMVGHGPAVPAPLARAIQSEVSGIEATVPVMQFQGDATTKVVLPAVAGTPRVFKEQTDIVFTTNDYFELLPFEWLAGDPRTSLQEPFGVVITESRAKLYFPGVAAIDMIGRRITYNENIEVFVTGVLKDLDKRTDFSAVEFISNSTISKTALQGDFMMNQWNDWMAYSKLYLKLESGKTAAATEQQLKALMKKYNPDNGKNNRTLAFHLQPLEDIHFNTTYAGCGQRTADKNVLYGLLAIACFLLLLACINFTNLSTAQASRRMKEICIRKTIGSSRHQLIVQFLGETFLITTLAALLSLALIPLLLDLFSAFTPSGMKFELFDDPLFAVFIVALIAVVTFFSGFYPALVISRYRPIAILKGQAAGGQSRGAFVRKTLTVSQFVIAQFFVIAALLVGKQIHYSLHQDMGFRKEAILNIETPWGRDSISDQHRREFYDRLSALPGIQMISKGFLPPAMQGGAFGNISFNDGKHETKTPVQIRWGDANYLKLYGIPLVAGRNVMEGNDGGEALINENYLHELGIQNPDEVIGQFLEDGEKKIQIVGVMKDFHQGSFHSFISPVIFQSSTTGAFFHIALEPNGSKGNWQTSVEAIQKIFSGIYPDSDFVYAFYDDTIAQLYKKEQDTAALLNWAMGLTVLISCLGLLGLVMYTSITRTKEIGIRKVMGATISNLVSILSIDFVKPVLVAFVIAAPLAAWAMNGWLEKFAYRTAMSWWIFAAAGAMLLFAAVVTLSFQTIRTAMDSPVKSLRNE